MSLEAILLKQPYEISFTGNPMPFSFVLTPYGTVQRQQDIRLTLRILVEETFGSSHFTEVRAETFYPNNDGFINMDVRTIIDPYLEYYIPKMTLTKTVLCPLQRKRYKLSWVLQKDGASVGDTQESAVLYAIKGGMAYDRWHPSEYFTKVILEDKKPLFFPTTSDPVGLDENRFMYWVYPYDDNEMNTVKIKIKIRQFGMTTFITTEDGAIIIAEDGQGLIPENGNGGSTGETITTISLPPTAIAVGKWSVWCCPIGFRQTGLDAQVAPGDYAIEYTVSVETATKVVVAPFTYQLDYRNFYDTVQILYRTSPGGMETIRMRGEIDFAADYAPQQAQRTVPPSYFQNLTVLPQDVTAYNEETDKRTGDTGFIKKESLIKLRDLLLSPQRYELENNKLLPITITTKSPKFYTNKDDLYAGAIEWQKAYVNEFFTPINLMPSTRSCPAVERFSVKQISKNLLQIMWALPAGYDLIEVDIIVGATTSVYTYTGNVGSILQAFTNPATSDPVDVSVKGRTICDENSTPIDAGPYTTVIVSVKGNSLPVVNDDTYTINAGYNSPIALQGSTLANDYDPDNDAIEVIAASGATTAGGTYSIDAAGNVTYQPPSSTYIGTDSFIYQVREVGGTTAVSGHVFINVGTNVSTNVVYARIVLRNYTASNNGYNTYGYGEEWLVFFSDPAGSNPLDVTGMGITFNVEELTNDIELSGTTTNTSNYPTVGAGKEMKLFEGVLVDTVYDNFNNMDVGTTIQWVLANGTNYVVI